MECPPLNICITAYGEEWPAADGLPLTTVGWGPRDLASVAAYFSETLEFFVSRHNHWHSTVLIPAWKQSHTTAVHSTLSHYHRNYKKVQTVLDGNLEVVVVFVMVN